MELSSFTNDEIRAIKRMMGTYGEKTVDLTDVPTFDTDEKEAILKFFAELLVLPAAKGEGLYTDDDLVSFVVAVSAAAFGPVGSAPRREISLITYTQNVAQMAYNLGVHDAAAGGLSGECQQRVAAVVEEELERSRKLTEFHDWLKDL